MINISPMDINILNQLLLCLWVITEMNWNPPDQLDPPAIPNDHCQFLHFCKNSFWFMNKICSQSKYSNQR